MSFYKGWLPHKVVYLSYNGVHFVRVWLITKCMSSQYEWLAYAHVEVPAKGHKYRSGIDELKGSWYRTWRKLLPRLIQLISFRIFLCSTETKELHTRQSAMIL